MSWIWASSTGTATTAGSGYTYQLTDPNLKLVVPTAKLGFILYVY